MNRNEKVMLLVIIALLIGWMVGNLMNTPKTDLEIYTVEDIYYVNDLTVTTESGRIYVRFETQDELKKYISNITANDTEIAAKVLERIPAIYR